MFALLCFSFQYLANRVAGKNISKITYCVSDGM